MNRSTDNNKKPKKYETLLLISPRLSQQARDNLLSEVSLSIRNSGAEILAEFQWGLRTLAYQIQKCNEAYYNVLYFQLDDGKKLAEIESSWKKMEHILRFMTLVTKEVPETIEPFKTLNEG